MTRLPLSRRKPPIRLRVNDSQPADMTSADPCHCTDVRLLVRLVLPWIVTARLYGEGTRLTDRPGALGPGEGVLAAARFLGRPRTT